MNFTNLKLNRTKIQEVTAERSVFTSYREAALILQLNQSKGATLTAAAAFIGVNTPSPITETNCMPYSCSNTEEALALWEHEERARISTPVELYSNTETLYGNEIPDGLYHATLVATSYDSHVANGRDVRDDMGMVRSVEEAMEKAAPMLCPDYQYGEEVQLSKVQPRHAKSMIAELKLMLEAGLISQEDIRPLLNTPMEDFAF